MGVEQPDWAELPNELWQLIFQRVPLLDLVTTGRRVCRRWNQIISDENVCDVVEKILYSGNISREKILKQAKDHLIF